MNRRGFFLRLCAVLAVIVGIRPARPSTGKIPDGYGAEDYLTDNDAWYIVHDN